MRPDSVVLGAFAVAALVAIFFVDRSLPGVGTLGALSFAPVLAAAWLGSPRVALVVALIAISLRVVLMLMGVVPPVTAGAQAASLALTTALTALTATCIDDARRSSARARGIRELTQLLDTTRALSGTTDVDEILRQVVRSASALVARPGDSAGPRAAISKVEGHTITPMVEYDEIGKLEGGIFPIASHPAALRALRTGQAATCTREELLPPFDGIAREMGWTSAACAPIRVGGELFALLFTVTRGDHVCDETELRLLEGMADLAGLAMANARRADELRDFGRRMESLEKAKSDFLRLASHELRAPITVIRGYVSLFEEGVIGSAQMLAVVPALNAKLEEMNRFVDQMLQVAQLEDARLQLKLEQLDLRDVIRDAVRHVEPTLGEDHDLTVAVPATPVPVRADEDRLHVMLTNLLGNAVKYSPGGGEIRCGLAVDGDRARVEVSDHGLGISASDLHKLFTRFGRVGVAEHSEIGGTGLGLYLARELARLHGGDIQAESVPGQGSTFALTLPLDPR